jgi:hypothetical protein
MNSTSKLPLWLRSPTAVVVTVLLVLVLAAAIALVWRERAFEKELERELVELSAAGVPVTVADFLKTFPEPGPEEDASVLLKEALEFLKKHPPPSIDLIRGETVPLNVALDEETCAQLEAYCRQSTTLTNLLAPPGHVFRFPHGRRTSITNEPPVAFREVRQLMTALAAQATCAIEAGEAESANRWIIEMFRVANAQSSAASLVEHMIQRATRGRACELTERALNRVSFSAAQLASLQAALPPAQERRSLFDGMKGEHNMVIMAFQMMREGHDVSDVFGGPLGEPWWKRVFERWRSPGYKHEEFLGYLQFARHMQALEPEPASVVLARTTALHADFSKRAATRTTEMLVSWPRAIRHSLDGSARLDAARTALAIERYCLGHGKLPESLEALVPEFFPEPPRDVFDQLLRYQKLEQGYIVYSVGADLVDDGGLAKTNAAMQSGYDVPFTVRR